MLGNSETGSASDKEPNCCRPSVGRLTVCTHNRGKYMVTRCTKAIPLMPNAAGHRPDVLKIFVCHDA